MRLAILLPLAALLLHAAPSFAQVYKGLADFRLAPRIALVIGVSSYKESGIFGALRNPKNDADAIASELRRLNFDVFAPHENYEPAAITRQVIKQYLYDFSRAIRDTNAIGLIYFSGHGLELNGRQYLVPYDGYVRYDRDLIEELLPVRWFYDAFAHSRGSLNLLYVDACRNIAWPTLEGFGSPAKFDLETPEAVGVIPTYATLSGKTTPDGSGNMSPFAAAFVNSLKKPDQALAAFHSAIVTQLKTISPNLVPKPGGVGAYDFTFYPTSVTFNEEYLSFRTASRVNHRTKLTELSMKHSYGYVGRAAASRLAVSSPHDPVTRYVEVITKSPLLDENRRSSTGEEATVGLQLGVIDALDDNPKATSLPVYSPLGAISYIARSAVVPTTLSSVTSTLTFLTDGGGRLVLDDVSRKTLDGALRDTSRIRKIAINSYAYADGETRPQLHAALERQYEVVQAVIAAKIDRPAIELGERTTSEESRKNAVEFVVTTAQRTK